MITKIEGICAWKGCTEPATLIACGRTNWSDETNRSKGHPIPACYCKDHAFTVSEEGNPEYGNECPNCGCLHGVN